jgi:serine protease Do
MRTRTHAAHQVMLALFFVLLLVAGTSLAVAAATPSTSRSAAHPSPRLGDRTPFTQAPIPRPKPGPADKGAEGDATDAAAEQLEEAESDLAVTNLDDVSLAVVQIEAVGTFVDPSEGTVMNAAGSGSGFIIDPAGIAVTNNHVVTGAAFLKVYVAGESRARNARVLGVSECSDLAVIDIQGDGFHYLNWSDKPVRVGVEIYAAGFPLGDPEFTLTRGIIAKANADGESNWASVDRVIQHDASTNPGNSGGPIVDKDGMAIAIHYAGNSETNQYFAIAAPEAQPVLAQLRTGKNVDSIGINGEAFVIDDEVSGIWIASVASGSPADNAGIKPGDILLTMEGISLATAGTMTEYCNILRSHDPEDVLAVQVLRLDTSEMLEGQINGRPLAVSLSLAQEIEEQGDEPGGAASGGATYDEYVTISDDSGALTVEVPAAWDDVEGGPWVSNDKEIGLRLMASPDLDAMLSGWDTPGLYFGVSASFPVTMTTARLLDGIDYNSTCTYEGRSELPAGFYTGHYDIWSKCGSANSTAAVVALAPESNAYLVLFEIYAVSEADLVALDRILDTFIVKLDERSGSSAGAGQFETVDTSGLVYDYVVVSQPALTGLLPAEYDDIVSEDWVVDDEVVGLKLTAAPDVTQFNDSWTAAGLSARTAADMDEEIDIDEWLDAYDLSEYCEQDDRIKHSHTINGITYIGAYDIWIDCSASGNVFVHLVAQSDPIGHLVLIDFQVIDEADVEALDVLLRSFYVDTGTATTTTSDGPEFEYKTVTDDTETISVRVPVDWDDLNGASWAEDGETIGVSVSAAPDLDGYYETWTTPGMFYGATATQAALYDAAEFLGQWDYSSSCAEVERFDYDDPVFSGVYDLYSDCGDEGNVFVVLAAAPTEMEGILVLIQVSIPAGTSAEPLEQILASFTIDQVDSLLAQTEDAEPDAEATVTVLAPTLNVRAGPSTNHERIGSVSGGTVLTVVGQVENCGWFQVVTPDGQTGWVSGGAQFVTLTGVCGDIPQAAAPAPPRTTTSGNTGNTGSGGNTGSSGNTSGTGGQACITFRNNLGAELTVTFTRPNDQWNKTFKVAGNRQHRECFNPGRYTLTVDAPPPWGSFNDDLTLSAGDNFPYDVNPGE